MEANASSGSSVFIDLSTSDLLEEFNGSTRNTSQQDTNDPVLKRKLKCLDCNRYTTSDEGKMTRHIRKVHRGENPYQCYMCDYSTYNNCLFDEHVRIHKGIKPFKCAFCPHRNVSKKNLKRHEKIHRPDNPLKCANCDHIARNKRSFDCHAKKCPPDKVDASHTCSWCDKQFEDENALVSHKSHLRTCNMPLKDSSKRCAYTTCSYRAMNQHEEQEHGKPKRTYKARVSRYMFKCSLCEWSSNRKTKILLHLVHHPNQLLDENFIDLSVLRKHGIME
ncbi:zinc finger imprinted 3-like isoform X2 [Pararge aegeria]|uniref:zinc finger imprinted 3-like isoform X2 n=1 Tax=Pararge aegeria TaxID=116150 RepID=UPI0019D06A0D|nr:zinc finger imprinted 3-like isoform X2 [Pararge aegeria]